MAIFHPLSIWSFSSYPPSYLSDSALRLSYHQFLVAKIRPVCLLNSLPSALSTVSFCLPSIASSIPQPIEHILSCRSAPLVTLPLGCHCLDLSRGRLPPPVSLPLPTSVPACFISLPFCLLHFTSSDPATDIKRSLSSYPPVPLLLALRSCWTLYEPVSSVLASISYLTSSSRTTGLLPPFP